MSDREGLLSSSSPLAAARSALAPAFTVEQEARTGEPVVRDELGKIVCRLAVAVAPSVGWWVDLRPLRGYDKDRARIEWLLLAHGFTPAAEWSNVDVAMEPAERSDVAVARVLLRLRAIQGQNLPGTLVGTDIEYLHDFRVAIRRTRSVLREMRGVFAPADLERVRASFKWLQDQTSATRDLDVYLRDFEELRAMAPGTTQADLAPLHGLLSARHRGARAAMEEGLRSERARALHTEWLEILEGLILEDEDARPDAARPIGDLAAERIRKVHRTMVRMGRAITLDSPPEDYHELRKKGKELRYLLELFAKPLFDGGVVRAMIKSLKGLQDVLGLHQDREVQMEMLKEIASSLVSKPGGAGALMAIGVLIERLEADAHAARARFAASFAAFASESQCKLVTDAFNR